MERGIFDHVSQFLWLSINDMLQRTEGNISVKIHLELNYGKDWLAKDLRLHLIGCRVSWVMY